MAKFYSIHLSKAGRLLWILLLIHTQLTGFCQAFKLSPDLRFDNYHVNKTGFDDFVGNITRIRKGYVWACGGGIARFDGKQFRKYSSYYADDRGLRADYCDDLVEDSYNRLWIGNSGGLCYYDEGTDKFIYLNPDTAHPINYAFAYCIIKNKLWFVCNFGLCNIDLSSLQIQKTALTTITDPIFTYAADSNTIVISTRTDYFIYRIKEGQFEKRLLTYNGNAVPVYHMIRFNNKLYAGTGQGIWIFSDDMKTCLPVKGTDDYIVYCFAAIPPVTGDSLLWFGTSNHGLNVLNVHTGKVEFSFSRNQSNSNSILSDNINNMYVDQDNILWMSTDKGISSFNYNNQYYKTQLLLFGKGGNTSNTVLKVVQDAFDKDYALISCSNQGLLRVNWKTKAILKQYETIYAKGSEKKGCSTFFDVLQVDKGRWLLNATKGLLLWNEGESAAKSFDNFPLPAGEKPSFRIRSVVHTNKDTFFVTTNCGLFRYCLNSEKIDSIVTGPYSDHPSDKDMLACVYEGAENLWIATRNGLADYNLRTQKFSVYKRKKENKDFDNFMFSVSLYKGRQVLCGFTRGLGIFDIDSLKYRFIEKFGEIKSPEIHAIRVRGNIAWMNSNAGLISYDLEKNRSSIFMASSGFYSTEPIGAINDEMVVGFRNAYSYFNGDQLLTGPGASAPVIEQVVINNQRPVIPGNKNEMQFTYDQNILSFYFTAFEFNDPEHIGFRYRIEGLDDTWNYAGAERNARYTHLPPGAYTFVVQAANGRGEWNNIPAQLPFRILPPFWMTWWFRLLVVLAILGILYSIYRYRINNIRELENIRRKIAADFHDDLGSTLSSISIYSEVARQSAETNLPRTKQLLTEIGEKTRSIIVAMNDMIWSVKPENDTLERLLQHMQEFGVPVTEAKDVKLIFTVADDLKQLKLNMIARKNLYYVYKEALNNALKYSGANTINILFRRYGKEYIMEVADDGKGFDRRTVKKGNGLDNMTKRIKEIGGRLDMVSTPGEGTAIVCHFKIA